jgi:photosystem II stability/assembly factor-like uncharacterized protein
VLAAAADAVFRSTDGGQVWRLANLPPYVTGVLAVAFTDKANLAITREGAFLSRDGDDKWQHVIAGTENIAFVHYDAANARLLGLSGSAVYESRDGGQTWTSLNASVRGMRALAVAGARLVGITAFDGLVAQAEAESSSARRAAPAAANIQ